jgi:hypothetical protein
MNFNAEKDLSTLTCVDAAESIVSAVSFKSANSPAISDQYFKTLKFSKSKIIGIVSNRLKISSIVRMLELEAVEFVFGAFRDASNLSIGSGWFVNSLEVDGNGMT